MAMRLLVHKSRSEILIDNKKDVGVKSPLASKPASDV